MANSFRYAGRGFWHCVRRERNFRIHLVAAACAAGLACLLKLDRKEMALLFLTIGAVLAMEMLNTAVEALVDLCAPHPHPLAKTAKDVAAGAVLVAAALSAAVGFSLFWRPEALLELLDHLLGSPKAFWGLAAFFTFALWFIFGLEKPKNEK